MKKRVLSFLLAAIMLLSVVPMTVFAEPANEEENLQASAWDYWESAGKAVNTTSSVLNAVGAKNWGPYGQALTSYVENVKKGIQITNTILGFLGLGRKSTAPQPTIEEQIYEELVNVRDVVYQIDTKVDQILNTLTQMQIKSTIENRINAARDANNAWKLFKLTYQEMQDRIYEYEDMMSEAIEDWCLSPSIREETEKLIGNTRIALIYEDNDDPNVKRDEKPILNPEKEAFALSDQNTKPTIILGEKCLPDMDRWSFDTYRDQLESYIREKVTTALNSKDEGSTDGIITVRNSKSGDFAYTFTKEGWAKTSTVDREYALDVLFEDAHEQLLYRLSIIVANQAGSDFVGNIKRDYENFCNGICYNNEMQNMAAAVTNTHGFEGEIAESFTESCGALMIQTAQYSTFMLDFFGKRNKTGKADLDDIAKKWYNTAREIEKVLNDTVTGHDNRSLVSDRLVNLIPLRYWAVVTGDVLDKYNEDQELCGYRLETMGITPDSTREEYPYDFFNTMLRTQEGTVQYYTYLGNAGSTKQTVNDFVQQIRDFGGDPCASRYKYDYSNERLILDWSEAIDTIDNDDAISTRSQRIKYGYFRDEEVKRNSKDFDRNYLLIHKKITGDFLDSKTNDLLQNQLVFAMFMEGRIGNLDWQFSVGPDVDMGKRYYEFWDFATQDRRGSYRWRDTGLEENTINYIYTLAGPVYERGYRVKYQWDGTIPEGVTLPTDSKDYQLNDSPELDTTYTEGMTIETETGIYTFSGWDASEDEDLTAEGIQGDVTYKGHWTFTAYHAHLIRGTETDFKPWTSDNSLPRNSGNYYLTTDVTLTDTKDPYQGTEINLCLNGHVIRQSATGKRCMTVHPKSTLNIHDCNGDNCTHEGYVDGNGLWHLGKGEVTATSITGGVITGSTDSGIYVHSGGCLNMYGGTVAGNKAGNGGAIRNDGEFNLYGGAICYNTAANGGGVETNNSGAVFNMVGGEISYNTSSDGAGVSVDHGTCNMYGGDICNNTAKNGGGVINFGTFNMSGGTISNNKASSYGGGVYDDGNMVVGGSSVIVNNTKGGKTNNVRMKSAKPIAIGTGDNAPTKDMKVGITLKENTGAFTKECSDYSANFVSDNGAYKVVYINQTLSLEMKNAAEMLAYFKEEKAAHQTLPTDYSPEEIKALLEAYDMMAQNPEIRAQMEADAELQAWIAELRAKLEAEEPSSPQTGDNSNMALWVILLALSSMGLCACLVHGKKRKNMQ